MVFFVTPLFVDSTLGDSYIFPVCLRMPIGHPFFLFNTILILPIYKKKGNLSVCLLACTNSDMIEACLQTFAALFNQSTGKYSL